MQVKRYRLTAIGAGFLVQAGCKQSRAFMGRRCICLIAFNLAWLATQFDLSAVVFAQTSNTPPDLMKQAQTLADTRIQNFKNSLDNPVTRRTAFLEMQADPIAVSRLNAVGANKEPLYPDLIKQANMESIAVREPVKVAIQNELAAKYGVNPNSVKVVEFGKTPQGDPTKFGQDWDLTARINGRDVPAAITRNVANKAYLESATTVGGVKDAVTINTTNPETGVVSSITPNDFAHRQSLAVTDHIDAEAYGGGKVGGQAINDIAANKVDPGVRLRDPTQLSQAIEYKSNEAANRAAELSHDGPSVDAEAWRLEQVRQSTKQFDKFVEPMVQANGGQVPATLKDGMDVLKQVSSGEITPDQAEARLKAMGEVRGGQPESIQSIIQKNAQLVEAAQVLKPPGERGAAIDRNDFVESVRDQLANKGINLDPDTPRDIADARRPIPKTPEEVAQAAQDLRNARQNLIDNIRNNDLLDAKTRNTLADNIQARDAAAKAPAETPTVVEPKVEASGPTSFRQTVKGGLLEGTRVVGEGMMISDGLNLAQDLVDYSQGKKTGSEVTSNIRDLATMGLWSLGSSMTEKALERADALSIIQAANDATWLVDTGLALRRTGAVSPQDVLAIMKALSHGDDSLLQQTLANLKAMGIDVNLPQKQAATIEGDEGTGYWSGAAERARDVGKGIAEKLERAGMFLINTGENLIEIPIDSIDAVLKSFKAFRQAGDADTIEAALINDLVQHGADPDAAWSAVHILYDSNFVNRDLYDRLKFELAALQSHPELRKLSQDDLDRALANLYEQYLAAKNAPPEKTKTMSEADKLALANSKADQAKIAMQALLKSLADASAKDQGLIQVPDVRGSDPETAGQTIKSVGLTPSPVPLTQKSGNVKPNVIQAQSPDGGSFVTANTSVELYFFPGKPSTSVTKVPNILTLTQEEAEKKIVAAKLKPQGKAGERKPMRTNKRKEVYSQFPGEGTEVKEGDPVIFEYLAGLKVGRYVQKKKPDAEAAIKMDGFTPKVHEGDQMAQNAADRLMVYGQTPAPGEYKWFDEVVDASYYKFSEGFQQKDGARVDGRFSEAVVTDGEVPGIKGNTNGQDSAIYYFPKNAGQGGKENKPMIGWMIRRYADADSAKAYVADQAKTTMPDIKSAGMTVERKVTATDASYYTSYKTAVSEGSYIRRLVVHREFVILHSHVEPVAGQSFTKEADAVVKKSIEVINDRFPPD